MGIPVCDSRPCAIKKNKQKKTKNKEHKQRGRKKKSIIEAFREVRVGVYNRRIKDHNCIIKAAHT